MSLQRGINLRSLAEKMGQCSGAEVRGICTEAGMYALRERRQHVTQEDFEFAIAKVCRLTFPSGLRADTSVLPTGVEEASGRKYVRQQVVLVVKHVVYLVLCHFATRSYRWRIQNLDAEDQVHVTTAALDNLRHTFPYTATAKWYKLAHRYWQPERVKPETVLKIIWSSSARAAAWFVKMSTLTHPIFGGVGMLPS